VNGLLTVGSLGVLGRLPPPFPRNPTLNMITQFTSLVTSGGFRRGGRRPSPLWATDAVTHGTPDI